MRNVGRDAIVARWLPFAIAILGFIVISPALWTGWAGDDAGYSALRGILSADHISLGQAMLHAFDLWFFGNGRFYPIHIIEKYAIFYAFPNLVAYKVFLVATTLIVVEMFRRCVAAYATPAIAALSALIVVTLFSERGYHDSIISYNAMPQFVAALMLGSFMAYRRALVGGELSTRVVAIACYAVAALTYEDVYPLCLLYPLLALVARKSRREALLAAVPFVAIAIALTLLAIVMRGAVHLSPGSNYATDLDPLTVARTATDQIVAAFPLSYWFFDPHGIFGRSDVWDFLRNAPVSPLLFVAFVFVAWFAVRDASRSAYRVQALVWIGAAVAVLPALPIALVLKYQHELRPGLGYLPVFFQVFGVALVIAAAAIAIARRYPSPRALTATAAAIALIGTMTQATNLRLAREAQRSTATRAALERQLVDGLISRLPDSATIAVPHFDWVSYGNDGPDGISTRGLFFADAGKNVILVPPGDARAQYVLLYDASSLRWSIAETKATPKPSS